MTPLISVQGLITVLVIAGLPRFQQAGLNLPSEAVPGCMGQCFLQGRQCPPWSSLALGMVALALTPWAWGITLGGSCGAQGRSGEKERAGVFVVLLFECAGVSNCISLVEL